MPGRRRDPFGFIVPLLIVPFIGPHHHDHPPVVPEPSGVIACVAPIVWLGCRLRRARGGR
jgi:hypothetical protein